MRSDFVARYGPWALVTGASSGIGEALARELAALGINLVICARRKTLLETLASELTQKAKIQVRIAEVDLSTLDFMPIIEAAIADIDLGLLINNAGFGDKGAFLESDLSMNLRMLDTNCRAPLILTHALAPRLIKRGKGGILFTSSTAAFQGLPFATHYAATKGFDLQLAEGLWYELKPLGVDVLALCPGPTDTEGPRRTGVNPEKMPIKPMTAQAVAKSGLNALGRKHIVIPGLSNGFLAWLVKMVPRKLATAIAGRMIQRVTA